MACSSKQPRPRRDRGRERRSAAGRRGRSRRRCRRTPPRRSCAPRRSSGSAEVDQPPWRARPRRDSSGLGAVRIAEVVAGGGQRWTGAGLGRVAAPARQVRAARRQAGGLTQIDGSATKRGRPRRSASGRRRDERVAADGDVAAARSAADRERGCGLRTGAPSSSHSEAQSARAIRRPRGGAEVPAGALASWRPWTRARARDARGSRRRRG